MTVIDLNLLEVLGVTKARTLASSPALTLLPDGRIISWDYWRDLDRYRKKAAAGIDDLKAIEKHAQIIDLPKVRKIFYHEDLYWADITGFVYFVSDDAIHPYSSQNEDSQWFGENPWMLDPMWLAVPEFQNFLSQHIVAGIRSDLDSRYSWRSRKKQVFPSSDGKAREMFDISSVMSPLGTITWDYEQPRCARIQLRLPGWLKEGKITEIISRDGKLITSQLINLQ